MRLVDAKVRSDRSKVHLQDIDPDTGEVLNLVKQEFKDECDLNTILKRFTPQSLEESLAASNGVFGDFSQVMDYGDARMLVEHTNSAFMRLPSKVRAMFGNDPEQLADFLDDPENHDAAVKLGLKVVDSEAGKSAEIVPPEPLLDVTGGTDTASVS